MEENNNRPPFQVNYLLLLQQAGNLLKDAGQVRHIGNWRGRFVSEVQMMRGIVEGKVMRSVIAGAV